MSVQAVQSVTLTWNTSTNQNLAGYEIFYGAASHTYTNSVKVSGNATNATITGLLEGTTYYFGAKTYDATGTESDFSNEATYAVPAKVVVATGNVPPALDPISNMSVVFNAGVQTIGLSGITSGATNENQTLAVTVKSSNPTLISSLAANYTSPQSTGTLTFKPAANRSGSAVITVTVNDGGMSNNIISRSFTVTVLAPGQVVVATGNVPPALDPISNMSVVFNAGVQTVGLSGITSGATNENQALTVMVKNSNAILIPSLAVNYTSPQSVGTLTFKPAANRSGSAVITVTVNDGGSSNNVISRSFTVTVLAPGQVVVAAPAIVSASTNIAAVVGQSLVLNVGAAGGGALGYQWNLNGTPVATTTNGTLTITQLTASQAGTYTVTVTNSVGTASGTIAQVAVYATAAATLAPLARTAGSNFGLQVTGVPGYQYVVQTSTNLVNWISVTTNTAPFNYQDTGSSPAGRRFYRTYSL